MLKINDRVRFGNRKGTIVGFKDTYMTIVSFDKFIKFQRLTIFNTSLRKIESKLPKLTYWK